jgi:hypothetical protein
MKQSYRNLRGILAVFGVRNKTRGRSRVNQERESTAGREHGTVISHSDYDRKVLDALNTLRTSEEALECDLVPKTCGKGKVN